jgi:hypothetical protein
MKKSLGAKTLVYPLALFMAGLACNGQSAESGAKSPGVVINQARMDGLYDQMARTMTSAPARRMKGPGVACVQGGLRTKVLSAGAHEILLSMPQSTDTQIPICFAVGTTLQPAGIELRLREREGSNMAVSVRLNAAPGQEVQINWSALILLADKPGGGDHGPMDAYRRATSCVQSTNKQVNALADRLWPADGKVEGYAAAIQDFIRQMKQQKPPRSMDAVSIVESGANWICTANANLAAALLRAKGIACRSLAVVPLTGQKLEMHRVIEYSDAGRWTSFDPSLLNQEIPLRPWQNVIMAQTTIGDEELAMKPRMGSAFGCPYGQEVEFLDSGVSLWGNDFFWTLGKPLAEFEVSDKVVEQARQEWVRFLRSGELSQTQLKAASVTDAEGLLRVFEMK